MTRSRTSALFVNSQELDEPKINASEVESMCEERINTTYRVKIGWYECYMPVTCVIADLEAIKTRRLTATQRWRRIRPKLEKKSSG